MADRSTAAHAGKSGALFEDQDPAVVCTCPCCSTTYEEGYASKTPYILSCGHTICGACVTSNSAAITGIVQPDTTGKQSHAKQHKRAAKEKPVAPAVVASTVFCPLCSRPTIVQPGKNDLVTNKGIVQFMRRLHAQGATDGSTSGGSTPGNTPRATSDAPAATAQQPHERPYQCAQCGESFDMQAAATTPFMLDCGHVLCASCAIKQAAQTGSETVVRCPCCSHDTHTLRTIRTAEDAAKFFATHQKQRMAEVLRTRLVHCTSITAVPPAVSEQVDLALPQRQQPLPPPHLPTPAQAPPQTLAQEQAQAPVPAAPAAAVASPRGEPCVRERQSSFVAIESSVLCPKHGLPTTRYCRAERTLFCERCDKTCDEAGHSTVSVASAVPAMAEDLLVLRDVVPSVLEALAQRDGETQQQLQEALAKAQAAETVIVSAMDVLRAQVDELQSRLLRGLALGTALARRTAEDQHQQLLQASERLEQTAAALEEAASSQQSRSIEDLWATLSGANDALKQSQPLLDTQEAPLGQQAQFVLTELKTSALLPCLQEAAMLQTTTLPQPALAVPDALPAAITLAWSLGESRAVEAAAAQHGAAVQYEVEVVAKSQSPRPLPPKQTAVSFAVRGAAIHKPLPQTSSATKSSDSMPQVHTTSKTFYVLRDLRPQGQYLVRVRAAVPELRVCGPWSEQLCVTAPPPSAAQAEADERVKSVAPDAGELDISGHALRAVPHAVLTAQRLTALTAHTNQLAALPYCVAELERLVRLDVHGNRLCALPDSLGHLAALEELDTSSNELTALPESLCRLGRLRVLAVDCNHLTALPERVGDLAALQTLSAHHNEVADLPPSLTQLQQLETLALACNRLRRLPCDLGRLCALRSLSVASNVLGALPDSLVELAQLRTLDATDNRMRALPAALGALANLTQLLVSVNELACLPDSVGDARALERLCASSNRLVALPASVAKLGKLVELNVANNRLDEVPGDLMKLKHLRSLVLYGNPCSERYDSCILATGQCVATIAPPPPQESS